MSPIDISKKASELFRRMFKEEVFWGKKTPQRRGQSTTRTFFPNHQ